MINKFKITHCNKEVKWIDNVPGKEYWYCGVCKNEVVEPMTVEEPTVVLGVSNDLNDWDDDFWNSLINTDAD